MQEVLARDENMVLGGISNGTAHMIAGPRQFGNLPPLLPLSFLRIYFLSLVHNQIVRERRLDRIYIYIHISTEQKPRLATLLTARCQVC